ACRQRSARPRPIRRRPESTSARASAVELGCAGALVNGSRRRSMFFPSPPIQTGRAGPIIPAISPLSDVQFSRFAETEVAKLLTFGRPRGVLEVMVPMTDDERRDLEAHIKEHFRLSAALQVKASYVLYRLGRAPRFQKSFVVKPERLIEDLFFFYFFGYLDLETMAYRAPVFLVPSHIVHKEAVHQLRGGLIHFNFI